MGGWRYVRTLLLSGGLLAANGCFYTEPIATESDSVFYMGQCLCATCPDPGATPGSCNSPTTASVDPVQICQTTFLESNNPSAIFAALSSQCNESETMPPAMTSLTQCDLVQFVGRAGNPVFYERGLEQGVCTLADLSPLPTFRVSEAPHGSIAWVTSSLRLSGPALAATAEITGELSFTGGNCLTGACPISIQRLELRSANVDLMIDGNARTATESLTINRTVGSGTCSSLAPAFNACGFVLDPNSLTLAITAVDTDGSRKLVEAKNIDQGGGVIVFGSRKISINQVFQSGDATVEFQLDGNIENLAPHVTLPQSVAIACGNQAQVTAQIEDVDGSLAALSISWLVDGRRAQVGNTLFNQALATGPHRLEVIAIDAQGGIGRAATVVTVIADITPPMLTASALSACVWPPNHKQRVFVPNDFGLMSVDECDAVPTIEFVSGSSSQPDNGIGDGNTVNDIVVQPASVCVRNERQGGVVPDRTYRVVAVATDRAGNKSLPLQLEVRVPHDRSGANACDVLGGTAAAANDSRCIPLVAPSASPAPSPAPSQGISPSPITDSGCSTGAPVRFGGFVLLGIFFCRKRNRKC